MNTKPSPAHTAVHVPEPWTVVADSNCDSKADLEVGRKFSITTNDGEPTYITICEGDIMPDQGKANANRIVACVNACAGLNPAAVADVVKALDGMIEVWGLAGYPHITKLEQARAALHALREGKEGV